MSSAGNVTAVHGIRYIIKVAQIPKTAWAICHKRVSSHNGRNQTHRKPEVLVGSGFGAPPLGFRHPKKGRAWRNSPPPRTGRLR